MRWAYAQEEKIVWFPYRADYEARLGIARQQAASETKTVNSRPRTEHDQRKVVGTTQC